MDPRTISVGREAEHELIKRILDFLAEEDLEDENEVSPIFHSSNLILAILSRNCF